MAYWKPESAMKEDPLNPKIDTIGILQVIYALENGQSTADIAREYGVQLQYIAHLYKQKEKLWNKYKEKFKLFSGIRAINLDESLVKWVESQLKSGHMVNEQTLRQKALDLASPLKEEFSCVDDWLLDFRTRHRIQNFKLLVDCPMQTKEEWLRFIMENDVENIYIGGISALYHSLDFDNFINDQLSNDYVHLLFITNCFGSDKQQLIITGKEAIGSEFNSVKSISAKYYNSDSTPLNPSAFISHLIQWDCELTSKGKTVLLVLSLPGLLDQIQFTSIRLIDPTSMTFIMNAIDKLTECLKYNYRRLQIIKKVAYGKLSTQFTLLDFIDMMSLAWHCVSPQYINHLFLPPEEGSFYFNNYDDHLCNLSLSQWCQTYNIPVNLEVYSNLLDDFVHCDCNIKCFFRDQSDSSSMNVSEHLLQKDTKPLSSVEAYQAVKRLVTYLQGENAGPTVINSAKFLECHMENEVVTEIHEIVSGNVDDSK